MSVFDVFLTLAVATVTALAVRGFYRAGFEHGRDTGHMEAARRHARIMSSVEDSGEGRAE